MKTASLVLGIIGGALAVIFAIVFIAGGALMGGLTDAIASQTEAEGWEVVEGESPSAVAEAAAGTMWLIGIASIVGAVLGIVGGVLAFIPQKPRQKLPQSA